MPEGNEINFEELTREVIDGSYICTSSSSWLLITAAESREQRDADADSLLFFLDSTFDRKHVTPPLYYTATRPMEKELVNLA
jgi:hypothetical protein